MIDWAKKHASPSSIHAPGWRPFQDEKAPGGVEGSFVLSRLMGVFSLLQLEASFPVAVGVATRLEIIAKPLMIRVVLLLQYKQQSG